MVLEEALFTHITTDAILFARVGTRVYPLLIPQTADQPAMAYQRINAQRTLAHDGATGLTTTLMQITIQCREYRDAKSIANQLRTLLNGFRGWLAGTGGVWCHRIEMVNEIDADEEFDAALVRCDYSIIYRED